MHGMKVTEMTSHSVIGPCLHQDHALPGEARRGRHGLPPGQCGVLLPAPSHTPQALSVPGLAVVCLGSRPGQVLGESLAFSPVEVPRRIEVLETEAALLALI